MNHFFGLSFVNENHKQWSEKVFFHLIDIISLNWNVPWLLYRFLILLYVIVSCQRLPVESTIQPWLLVLIRVINFP
jgi:RsiW-degrading membrane proteinase PrsW (M82 family)